MNQTKKIFTLFLSVVMILTNLFVIPIMAQAGECDHDINPNKFVTTKITKATWDKTGKEYRKCKVCGEKNNITIPAGKNMVIELLKRETVYNGKFQIPNAYLVTKSDHRRVQSKFYTSKSWSNGYKDVGIYTLRCKTSYKYYDATYTIYNNCKYTIRPKGTSIRSLKAVRNIITGDKGVKVTWNKQNSQNTGYYITYSPDKNFTKNVKNLKITNVSTTAKTVTGLKSKTTYYFKIKTYKTVSGKDIYSAASSVKSVTTK